MKKVISLFICSILLITLCACSEKNSPDNSPAFNYEEVHYTQDFKNSEGKVISRLDMTYPNVKLKDNEDAQERIAKNFEEYKQAKILQLEKNVDSLNEFKERFSIEGVTIMKITYSYFYGGDTVLSFIMSVAEGTDPTSADPSFEAMTFSLADGIRLSLPALYLDGKDYAKELLMSKIRIRANETYSENGAALSDSQIELLDSLFNERNFVCTDDVILFLYPYSVLSSGTRQGIYYCDLSFAELEDFIISPYEYYENNNNPAQSD